MTTRGHRNLIDHLTSSFDSVGSYALLHKMALPACYSGRKSTFDELLTSRQMPEQNSPITGKFQLYRCFLRTWCWGFGPIEVRAFRKIALQGPDLKVSVQI